MQIFIGTKIVKAIPMTRGDAELKLKRNVGGEALREADGYFVEYKDGYQSWSPKDVFESAYRQIDGMTFSQALEAMMSGLKVKSPRTEISSHYLYIQENVLMSHEHTGEKISVSVSSDMIVSDGWELVE